MDFLYTLFGVSGTVSDSLSLPSTASSSVIDFLQQKTRLFDLISHDPLTDKKTQCLIKGFVQSGKSRVMYALCLYMTCVLGHNVVVIVRNFMDDYDQFRRGFEKFLLEYRDFCSAGDDDSLDLPHVYYAGDVKRTKNGDLSHHEDFIGDLSTSHNVVIALANHDQLSKFNDCMDHVSNDDDISVHTPFTVIIDEIDQLGYSMGDRFAPQLEHLVSMKADAVFGISATFFEPLQTNTYGFKTNRVCYLKPPPEYKGITHITYHCIEPTDGDLLKDPDLDRFLTHHCDHKPFRIHRNTMGVNLG